MSDDARRADGVDLELDDGAEMRRGWIHAARAFGRTCGNCGRPLVDDEVVWMERLALNIAGRRLTSYRAPVARECASPTFLRDTDGLAPERCLNCGRGVYVAPTGRRPGELFCSRWCGSHRDRVRKRGEAS